MWLQFFAQNAHFVVNLFAALICLGICWLYLDAWSNRHAKKELVKWMGFGLLGISFLVQATKIEQSILGKSLFNHWTIGLVVGSRALAYGLIILGQLIDPLQSVPKNEGLKQKEQSKPGDTIAPTQTNQLPLAIIPAASLGSKLLLPLGGFAIAALYWRRATIGLERHLKPVSKAFFLFAISDLIGMSSLLRNTSNPVLYTQVAAFGWVWWLQQITLVAGVIILGLWTWSYLLKRFFSQLFMILIAIIVIVFTIVSVGFTSLLLHNVQSNSLKNLNTAASVLSYALISKQSETMSDAQQLAGSGDVLSAIAAHDREKLKELTADFLPNKKLTGLIIIDATGQVLLRVQDAEQWGDSLSNDALVKRSLLGLDQSTVTTTTGVGAPNLQVRSAATAKDSSGNIAGSILASLDLSSAFVDGIKEKTSLESSVYANNYLAATTFLSPDGKSRPTGTKLSNDSIKERVLGRGENFSGTTNLQQKKMLSVFLPIKDVDNVPVGMLSIAQPQSTILQTAGTSVEVTFIIMTLLLVCSIYPILLIVRSLVRQIG